MLDERNPHPPESFGIPLGRIQHETRSAAAFEISSSRPHTLFPAIRSGEEDKGRKKSQKLALCQLFNRPALPAVFSRLKREELTQDAQLLQNAVGMERPCRYATLHP